MRLLKLVTSCSLLLLVASVCYAQPSGGGFVLVTEEDDSPSCYGYAIKVANDNLTDNADGTCSVADSGGSGGTTASGTITYVTDTTDNFSVEGTNSNAPFHYDASTNVLKVEDGYKLSDGTDINRNMLVVDRASTDVVISWDEINDEIDINFPLNVAGTANTLTFGNNETIDNATDDFIEFQGVSGTDNTDIRFDLDGTFPIIDSPTDTQIQINEQLTVTSSMTLQGTLTLNNDTSGTGQITMDGTSGGCLMFRDTDDAGWTECDALNGILSCSTDADGLCD